MQNCLDLMLIELEEYNRLTEAMYNGQLRYKLQPTKTRSPTKLICFISERFGDLENLKLDKERSC
jgi:hypothetical protein